MDHGTFCASVIVRNEPELKDVAPGAKLRFYKAGAACVQDVTTQIYVEMMLQALIKAHDDKVDVISISQGIPTAFLDDLVARLISRISEDIPIVVDAGNLGKKGMFTGYNTDSGDNVITAGAYESTELVTWSATMADSTVQELNVTYVSSRGWVLDPNSTFQVDYYDACTLKPRAINGTGAFAVVKTPQNCPFRSWFSRVSQAKYTGVMFAANDLSLTNPRHSNMVLDVL